MARYTFATASDTICKLDAQRDVYKVEVDEAKWALTHAFEADVRRAKEDTYLSIPHDDRSASDSRLYFDAPYSMVHWYGKKWAKGLAEAQDSALKAELIRIRDLYESTFQLLQGLAARQIKGRKPVVKEVVATRTQLRAICPCCFREQAVQGTRMVAHGYTIEYGFQNGNCAGRGKPHFGTEEGREITRGTADALRQMAVDRGQLSEAIAAGEADVFRREYRNGKYVPTKVENPSDYARKEYAQTVAWQAEQIMRNAHELDKAVANWKPKDPVEVQVEVTK